MRVPTRTRRHTLRGTRRIALSVYTLNTAEEQQLLQGDWSRSRKKSNMAENNSSRIL